MKEISRYSRVAVEIYLKTTFARLEIEEEEKFIIYNFPGYKIVYNGVRSRTYIDRRVVHHSFLGLSLKIQHVVHKFSKGKARATFCFSR